MPPLPRAIPPPHRGQTPAHAICPQRAKRPSPPLPKRPPPESSGLFWRWESWPRRSLFPRKPTRSPKSPLLPRRQKSHPSPAPLFAFPPSGKSPPVSRRRGDRSTEAGACPPPFLLCKGDGRPCRLPSSTRAATPINPAPNTPLTGRPPSTPPVPPLPLPEPLSSPAKRQADSIHLLPPAAPLQAGVDDPFAHSPTAAPGRPAPLR